MFSYIENKYYNIKSGIKQLYLWIPIIWKDRDYDHSFIYKILKFKIENTRKLNQKNKRYIGVEKEIYFMWVCENLLDRLIKDDYFDSFYDIYQNKWGKSNFDSIYREHSDDYELKITNNNIISEEDRKLAKNDYRRYRDMSVRNRNNDKKYLYHILEKRLDNWWD